MLAGELYRHRALVLVLARRDLVARYRGTALGFAWTLAHPLLYLGVYSVVFGRIARLGGDGYPAFLFVGLLPWTWFSSSLLVASTSILADGPLVKRAAFPPSVPPLVVACASLANFLLALPVLGVVLALWGVRPGVPWLALPLVVGLQFVLSLGLGTAAAALTVRFRDVGQLLQGLVPLAFLATPIAYPASLLEERLPALGRAAVLGNPLALLASSYQAVLHDGRWPDPLHLLVLAAWCALAWLAGDRVLARLRDRIPEEL